MNEGMGAKKELLKRYGYENDYFGYRGVYSYGDYHYAVHVSIQMVVESTYKELLTYLDSQKREAVNELAERVKKDIVKRYFNDENFYYMGEPITVLIDNKMRLL